MIEIKAKITKKVFEKDNYRIYGAVPTDSFGLVQLNQYGNFTLVGEVHELTINEEYKLTVKEEKSKYGLNYRILKVKRDIDISNLGNCETFLKEVLTARQCENILKVYPSFIQMVINNDDIDVKKIKGVGEKSMKKIKKKIIDNFVLVDFAEKYAPYGLTFNMISKLYQKYTSLEVLEEKLAKEPYKTLLALDRVGFKVADSIILKINPAFATSSDRMRECIKFSLLENQSTGSTYMSKDDLFNKCYEFTPECMDKFVEVLKDSPDIIIHKELKAIALKKTYESEENVCNMILEMNSSKTIWDFDIEGFDEVDGFTLSKAQFSVVDGICKNNVYILGGYSGCGKTASVQAVVNMCSKYKKKFLIAAPTGKASDVIAKTTGKKASTIHQLLNYVPEVGFKFKEDNKLEADLIIIDEFSMVDIFLIEALLEAIDRQNTKLLLVGDFAQLPSVGAGNVAHDLVNTNVIPKTLLTEVFRYGEGGKSMIIEKMRQGKRFLESDKPLQAFGKNKDYVYVDCEGEELLNQMKYIYGKLLNNGTSIEDILILSSQNKGDYGVNNINVIIQELINKSDIQIKYGSSVFKLNDRVMQTKNNYSAVEIKDDIESKGYIFNGNIGTIIDIKEEEILVDYGNKVIQYDKDDLDQLTLAYAISVHRSQGCTVKNVIFVSPPAHTFMLSRALMYVALTRAKETAYHLGKVKTVNLALKKVDTKQRKTFLGHLLTKSNT